MIIATWPCASALTDSAWSQLTMPGGMYFIIFWRKSRPAWLSLLIRLEWKLLSRREPPKGHRTRMKLSADCVSPRSDWSA